MSCANSIYLYQKDNDFMLLTNAVDDELIATNKNELRLKFLEFLRNDLILKIWEWNIGIYKED